MDTNVLPPDPYKFERPREGDVPTLENCLELRAKVAWEVQGTSYWCYNTETGRLHAGLQRLPQERLYVDAPTIGELILSALETGHFTRLELSSQLVLSGRFEAVGLIGRSTTRYAREKSKHPADALVKMLIKARGERKVKKEKVTHDTGLSDNELEAEVGKLP